MIDAKIKAVREEWEQFSELVHLEGEMPRAREILIMTWFSGAAAVAALAGDRELAIAILTVGEQTRGAENQT